MSASDHTPFGALLRRYRLAAGLTQATLAERAGLSERAINDLEREPRRTPRLETVTLLATALSLPDAERGQLLAAARPATLASDQPTTSALTGIPTAPASAPTAVLAPVRIEALPTPPDPFIRRAREVEIIRALLGDPAIRLLTLTGPGGIGKTRLAIQVASLLLTTFRDGVCFVGLGDLVDPALVPHAIASALGIRESAFETPAFLLTEALRPRHMLLILDNFEQALAAADDVERLLAACPNLTILVTSRSALHLAREREYPMPPMSLPPDKTGLTPEQYLTSDSMALLCQRARAALPDFTLNAANADTLAAICVRLDGVPLAIQLAAARLKYLSPASLLARLDQQLTLLTGGPRDAPARQRTVRATLDWSYQLLTPAQQTLLRRLAVFAGGWSLEAAEAICADDAGDGIEQADTLDLLASLVDQSLALVEERDGTARYRLLESVRQYAEEKLRASGEEVAIRDRHLAWMLALGERLAAETWIMPPGNLMRLLQPEGDNLRAAIAWSRRDTTSQKTLRLAGASSSLWVASGLINEGRQTLREALAHADPIVQPEARASALIAAAGLAGLQTDLAEIDGLIEEAEAILSELGSEPTQRHSQILLSRFRSKMALADARDEIEKACEEALRICRARADMRAVTETLYFWGDLETDCGDYQRARRHLEECLLACEQVDDPFMRAFPLVTLARVACAEGNLTQARSYALEGLALRGSESTWYWLRAVSLNALGEVERYAENDDEAAARFREALALYQAQADEPGIAWTRHNLGHLALRAGETRRALELFSQALTARARHRYSLGIATELAGLASIASASGFPARAARLFGAADALLRRTGLVLAPVDVAAFERDLASVRAVLDPGTFSAAWEAGAALSAEDATAEALAEAVAEALRRT